MYWICQLGEGYMLQFDEVNELYKKVYTGYPYPDTIMPQEEMLAWLYGHNNDIYVPRYGVIFELFTSAFATLDKDVLTWNELAYSRTMSHRSDSTRASGVKANLGVDVERGISSSLGEMFQQAKSGAVDNKQGTQQSLNEMFRQAKSGAVDNGDKVNLGMDVERGISSSLGEMFQQAKSGVLDGKQGTQQSLNEMFQQAKSKQLNLAESQGIMKESVSAGSPWSYKAARRIGDALISSDLAEGNDAVILRSFGAFSNTLCDWMHGCYVFESFEFNGNYATAVLQDKELAECLMKYDIPHTFLSLNMSDMLIYPDGKIVFKFNPVPADFEVYVDYIVRNCRSVKDMVRFRGDVYDCYSALKPYFSGTDKSVEALLRPALDWLQQVESIVPVLGKASGMLPLLCTPAQVSNFFRGMPANGVCKDYFAAANTSRATSAQWASGFSFKWIVFDWMTDEMLDCFDFDRFIKEHRFDLNVLTLWYHLCCIANKNYNDWSVFYPFDISLGKDKIKFTIDRRGSSCVLCAHWDMK